MATGHSHVNSGWRASWASSTSRRPDSRWENWENWFATHGSGGAGEGSARCSDRCIDRFDRHESCSLEVGGDDARTLVDDSSNAALHWAGDVTSPPRYCSRSYKLLDEVTWVAVKCGLMLPRDCGGEDIDYGGDRGLSSQRGNMFIKVIVSVDGLGEEGL